MIAVTFADLVFRARQFLIALVGVALVMAMALLLSGLANGFQAEVQWTVDGTGAENWVMTTGSLGGITAFSAFPQTNALAVAHQPGVKSSAPFLLVPGQSTTVDGKPISYSLVGVIPGRLGDTGVESGHRLSGPDQAVVDTASNARLGSIIRLGGTPFHVVGTVSNRTVLGGQALIYVELHSAQTAALGGRSLISAVLTTGIPAAVPTGLATYSSAAAVQATVLIMQSGISSINNSKILMWIVAAIIVAALLYVAALERRRDFAVLKALGSSSADLFGSLVLEAVIVTVVAAGLAEVLSLFMTGVFSQPVVVPISAYFELPVIAALVGVLASLVALRNATGADPAAAFS